MKYQTQSRSREDIFIPGEKVDLCAPLDEDFRPWAAWFNCEATTRFLEQGKFPNTEREQRAFYEDSVRNGRFIALIKTKAGELLGVISLSDINYEKGDGQISYVCPVQSPQARYAPLESLALLADHAFTRLRLNRIWSGHAYPGLERWIFKTELLGFFCEGLSPEGFVRGVHVGSAARTSLTRVRYAKLKSARNGHLWPGEAAIRSALENSKKDGSLCARLEPWLKRQHEARLADILALGVESEQ